jgi:hypothetical protein
MTTLPTSSPGGGVVFESPFDDDRGQLRDGVRDALGLAPPDRHQRHEDLGALLLRVGHASLHDVGGGRRVGRQRDALPDADEADPHAPDLADQGVAVVAERRRAGDLPELREAVGPVVPVVRAGSERREADAVQHARDRLGLDAVLVGPVALELGVHEEERPGRGDQRGGSLGLLVLHPGSEVVQPPELVLRAPARLERARHVGHQIQPHRG